MTNRILATATSFTDDGECTVLGFADNPSNPINYLTLEIANEPDEEEEAYGWAGIHIDAGGLHLDGYDLVQDIRETGTGLAITLTPDAAKKAGIERVIEIELKSTAIGKVSLADVIRRFKARLPS